jgi:hypothetical protein
MQFALTYFRRNEDMFLYLCLCLEFISSIPIISILLVILFILFRPDLSIFVGKDKVFQNFMHGIALCIYALGSSFSQKYAT